MARRQREDLSRDLQEAVIKGQDLELQFSEERKQKEQILTKQDQTLSELMAIKKELSELKGSEESRWQAKKTTFLSSSEFYELLGAKISRMLKYDFEGAGKQFIQSRLIPRGANLSFLNPEKVWDDLPDSEKQG